MGGCVESRVRAVVEDMRANADSADKQVSACETIARLAFGSAANRTAIGGVPGVFEAIVGAMRWHDGAANVQAYGCLALGNLAGDSDANRRAIGSVVGVFDAIVGAMRRHEGVPEVQDYGCRALGNLALRTDNRSAIARVAGVFDAIVGAMRRHEDVANVQSYGCFALCNLAGDNDANRRAIGSVTGVFDAIADAMRRHEGVPNVQEYGCRAVGNLARNDPNRSAIRSVAGVFDAIVGAMRRHEGVANVQRWACWALCQLATCSAATATPRGFLARLLGWLRSSNETSAEAQSQSAASRLAAVPGVVELLLSRANAYPDAALVLQHIQPAVQQAEARRREDAERRASDEAKRADDAMRQAHMASQRADREAKRADEEAKRADEEAKRADEEAKRADEEAKRADEEAMRAGEAEGRAAREQERADRAEAPPGPTPATARLAMVIANAEYQGDEPRLARCAADGEAMASTLRARQFNVTHRTNLGGDALELAATAFRFQVRANPGCIAVLYFTGHGFDEDNGDLFLVPVNGAAGVGGVPLSLRRVEQLLHQDIAGQESTIVIMLDCCRTNDNIGTYKGRNGPRWTHAIKSGAALRDEQYLSQYLVAYACESGTAAHADAVGAGLSPFTDALVPRLREGVPLEEALKRATTVVARQTGNTQRPSYRCSLGLDDDTAPLVL